MPFGMPLNGLLRLRCTAASWGELRRVQTENLGFVVDAVMQSCKEMPMRNDLTV